MESVKRGKGRRNKCINKQGTAHFLSFCLLVTTTLVLILSGSVHGQNPTPKNGSSAVSGEEAGQSGASGQGSTPKVNQKMNQSSFKAALNTFNFKFLNVVTSKEKSSKTGSSTQNVFYSPFSISTALGMVLAGSNGTTRDQIMTVLGLDSLVSQSGSSESSFSQGGSSESSFSQEGFEKMIVEYRSKPTGSRILANRMILNQGFEGLDSFKSIIRKNFQAEISTQSLSDQGIISVINDWVREKTKGLIGSLIHSPFDPSTQLVLLNAIYFKDNWAKTFDRKRTNNALFKNVDGSISNVPTMTKKEKLRFLINEHFNYSMIEMPYKSETRNRSPSPNGSSSLDGTSGTSMVILLPHEEKGILELLSNRSSLKQIQEDALKSVRKAFKVETDIYLPRFEMETSYDLKETLTELGMESLFNGATCDLSRINGKRPTTRSSTIGTSTNEGSKSIPESNTIESASGSASPSQLASESASPGVSSNNLHVSSVIHKAKLIINEEGSEAAAVTQVAISYRSMPLTEEFNVDHPFMFFIRDGDIITFTGIVYKL